MRRASNWHINNGDYRAVHYHVAIQRRTLQLRSSCAHRCTIWADDIIMMITKAERALNMIAAAPRLMRDTMHRTTLTGDDVYKYIIMPRIISISAM